MAVLTISVSELDLLRVRRTSDSTENDVNLREWDDGTLDTFVGANDGCVTTWFDASGNGNDVIQSTTTLQPKVAVSGTVQEGVVFDGIDDYLTKGSRLTSGSVTALTVAAFVKTTGFNTMIASELNGTGNQRSWYMGIYNGTGELDVVINQGGDLSAYKRYRSPSAVNNGAWRHVAFTFNAGTLSLYVDGSAVTPTKDVDGAVTSLFNTSAPFHVGTRGELANFFGGSMDRVGVWNSALTAGNIATLAAGGEVGTPLLWLKGNYSP